MRGCQLSNWPVRAGGATGAIRYPRSVDRRPGAAARVSSVLDTVAIQGLASHTVELLVLPRPPGGAAGYTQPSLASGLLLRLASLGSRTPALKDLRTASVAVAVTRFVIGMATLGIGTAAVCEGSNRGERKDCSDHEGKNFHQTTPCLVLQWQIATPSIGPRFGG
ncbi:hypothetical protein D3C76_1328770 [compost metagenome]